MKVKLITKEIERKLEKTPLYSTERVPTNEKTCIVKFFTPDSNWTWYVVEGERIEGGDWKFYGLVDGFEPEWGYFLLSELQSVRGALRLPVERDRFYSDSEWKRDLVRLGFGEDDLNSALKA